jgi:hypothetical protein
MRMTNRLYIGRRGIPNQRRTWVPAPLNTRKPSGGVSGCLPRISDNLALQLQDFGTKESFVPGFNTT